MYEAVSVWTTKLIKLSKRNPDATRYFLRVALAASRSGLLLRIVGLLVSCSIGRPSGSAFPMLEWEWDRRWRSSLRRGCCERPSVGRCNGGRLTTISSSESKSSTASGFEVPRGWESPMLSEATTAMVGEGTSRLNYLDMNTAVRGVLVRFTAIPGKDKENELTRGLSKDHPSR